MHYKNMLVASYFPIETKLKSTFVVAIRLKIGDAGGKKSAHLGQYEIVFINSVKECYVIAPVFSISHKRNSIQTW